MFENREQLQEILKKQINMHGNKLKNQVPLFII